jgi:ribosomal protein S18 acetylase RimI-like enzyme
MARTHLLLSFLNMHDGDTDQLDTDLGPLTVAPARGGELAVVLGIVDEAAAWLTARGIRQWASPQPPHERDKVRREIARGQVYLARVQPDGRAVGTLRFEWDEPDLWPDDPAGGGYVHTLATRPEARGLGVGARLLDWAGEHIRAHGRDRVRLDCWAENPPLCRYYERLGFRRRGLFTRGAWVGALYEKHLPASGG